MKQLPRIFFNSLLLVLFISVNIFNAYPQAAKGRKLYMCMSDLGPGTKSFIKQNNIQNIPIIYQRNIDPRNEMKLDAQVFTNAINKTIPDANATGYGVIDWEGKMALSLQLSSKDSDDYQNALSEFTKAIKLAKQLRPHIKWGFFGIPYQPLDKRDSRRDRVNSDIPLLQLCDAFYPQFYVPYNMDQASTGRRSKIEKDDLVSFDLLSNLKLANKMNKPVLVFIWHRYYSPGFKQNSLQLIPLDEFNNYIKEVLALNYNGTQVQGLIWWGEDSYFYGQKNEKIRKEVPANMNFNDYHDSLIIKYARGISQSTSKN